MTFDLKAAREICIKLGLKYPARSLIDQEYQCSLAAEMLPAALDEIEQQNAYIEQLSKQCQAFIHDEEIHGWIQAHHYIETIRSCKLLDVAKKWHAAYRKAQNSNLVRKQLCEQKDECISEQAKRIAELEKESADYESELIEALNDAGIQMGDGENPQDTITAIGLLGTRIADLQRLNNDLMANGNSLRTRAQRSETRRMELEEERNDLREKNGKQIEALKDGWKEDRAAKIFYEIYPGVSDYYSWKGYPEDPCQMRPKRSIREEASRQLAAEHPGLFGPEDITVKPAKIVLTEEQRAALGLVCDLADEYECKYASTADEQSKAIDTVRALLQEVRP